MMSCFDYTKTYFMGFNEPLIISHFKTKWYEFIHKEDFFNHLHYKYIAEIKISKDSMLYKNPQNGLWSSTEIQIIRCGLLEEWCEWNDEKFCV